MLCKVYVIMHIRSGKAMTLKIQEIDWKMVLNQGRSSCGWQVSVKISMREVVYEHENWIELS
jgi:hypothetical protein